MLHNKKKICYKISTFRKFNESTIQEILDQELEFVQINLKIDPLPEPRRPVRIETNWLTKFIKSTRKERVVWPTKIYRFDVKFSEKTMYEQADQLMDLVCVQEWKIKKKSYINFFLRQPKILQSGLTVWATTTKVDSPKRSLCNCFPLASVAMHRKPCTLSQNQERPFRTKLPFRSSVHRFSHATLNGTI